MSPRRSTIFGWGGGLVNNNEYESNSVIFVLTFLYLFIQLIYESAQITFSFFEEESKQS